MNIATILAALQALSALSGQVLPLINELTAAIRSGDDAQLDAVLLKLQAANDSLAAQ